MAKTSKAAEERKTVLVPLKENFQLKKVKVNKNFEGITVLYHVVSIVDEVPYEDNYSFESARELHKDFKDIFAKLRPIVARVFNATAFKTLVDLSNFKATTEQKQLAQKLYEEIEKNYDPRSLSLSGQGDKLKAIISSQFKTETNAETNVNTPNLSFSKESYGFELELEEIMQDIEQECYALIFEGKTGELTLFTASEDNQDEPAKEEKPTKGKKGKNSSSMPEVADIAKEESPADPDDDGYPF